MKVGTKAYFRRVLMAATSPTDLKLNRQYRRGIDVMAGNAALAYQVGRQDRQAGKPLAEWPYIDESTAPKMLSGSMAFCEQAYRLGYHSPE